MRHRSDFESALDHQKDVTVTEISCIPLAPDSEYVIYANAGFDKNIDFTGLDVLDQAKCDTAAEVFTFDSNPIQNYPWLVQSDKRINVSIADSNSITVDGRYQGFHSRGKAAEDFDMVICAIHPPALTFVQGQEFKEFLN